MFRQCHLTLPSCCHLKLNKSPALYIAGSKTKLRPLSVYRKIDHLRDDPITPRRLLIQAGHIILNHPLALKPLFLFLPENLFDVACLPDSQHSLYG